MLNDGIGLDSKYLSDNKLNIRIGYVVQVVRIMHLGPQTKIYITIISQYKNLVIDHNQTCPISIGYDYL
jgi:hypothetical protein